MSGATMALVVKEIRAAWPAWLLCSIAMVLPGLASSRLLGVGIFGYVVGSAVLGGQALGHEYTNRTLANLLAQPISRQRLLLVKLAVLAGMLAILAVVAEVFVFAVIRQTAGLERDPEMTALLWVPLLSAVCLAPWLTMLCRSALAGAVFSMVLPGLVQVIAALFSSTAVPGPATQPFGGRMFWTGCLALCATGGFMTWRTFGRLELVDLVGAFSLPRWASRRVPSVASQGHPAWVLLKKELRLQQMAFIITAGYLLTGLVAIVGWPRLADDALSAMSILYAAFIPALVGSVASAEERQLGTLEWQLLLPVASWKQWAVKAAVALAISVVLSLGLPAVLLGMDLDRQLATLAVPVVLLTVGSLYVSSLWSSPIWAFLTTIAGAVVAVPVVDRILRVAFANPQLFFVPGGPAANTPTTAAALLIGGAFLTAVLGCGLRNHRFTERSTWLVGKQVVALSGCLAIAIATWLVVALTKTGILQ